MKGRVREYRRDIDGLRSIAILSVVLFHAGLPGIAGGFTGVDIFFVISGYLIGGHIHADVALGTFSYLTFYQRRAKRILPALYAVLLALLVVGLVLFSPFELRHLAEYIFATAASASNILFWQKSGYFAPQVASNPLLMTWSLAVEEQFYLVIPLMMVLLSRLRHRLVLPMIGMVAVISFALAWLSFSHYPVADFYLLPSRAWELGVGVALAMIEADAPSLPLQKPGMLSNGAGLAGLGLAVAPLFFLNSSMPFPGPAALPSVLGSALLLASGGSWINRKVLTLSPLVFIGRVSYSWYLWHWPVLALIRILRGDNYIPLALSLSGLTLSFGLAVLSYYYVEQPFRSSRMAPGPLLFRYGAVSVLLLLVAGLIVKAGGLGSRYPVLDAIDQIGMKFQEDPCLAIAGESEPRLSAICIDSNSTDPKIAVWGDSTAAALSPAVRAQAGEQGYGVEEYAKTSCPPLIGVARNDPQSPSHLQECSRFNNTVLQRLASDPKVEIVALEGLWGAPLAPPEQLVPDGEQPLVVADSARSTALFDTSLRKTVLALRSAGKEVVLFGDTPRFDFDPLWRMRTSHIALRQNLAYMLRGHSGPLDPGAERSDGDTPSTQAARQVLVDVARSIPGVEFWSPRDQLCTRQDVCSYRRDDTPFYVDQNHLTPAGGRRALQGWSIPPLTPAP
jgi:peptidoglycan/LPS O-acetylase OafA/YrhL